MNKKVFILLTALFPLLASCNSGSTEPTGNDPFMIGDNLEAISATEAKLIASEAYNNLSKVYTLRRDTTNIEDSTSFYTGSFSSYAVNKKETIYSEVSYYSNMIDETRNTTSTTYFGNNSAIENKISHTISWYGIKPAKEGEEANEYYSLLTSTTESYNNIASTRYGVAIENFSDPENINPIWNRYIVESINTNYLNRKTTIAYSSENTYVKDSQHIIGYYLSTEIGIEHSKITPNKPDNDYVKKTTHLSVVDFFYDELLELGWTVRTVSTRVTTSYLTTADGKVSENPIEVAKEENIVSLQYEVSHAKSENIPEFKLTDSRTFSIAQFILDEETGELSFGNAFELENNDDYYRHAIDSFSGHSYYKELQLPVGYYSFFDGEPLEPEDYEKWGYEDIIANKCVNYIIDPSSLEESPVDLEAHPHLFYVAAEATFSFRIVFDDTMTAASEFTVAIVGR